LGKEGLKEEEFLLRGGKKTWPERVLNGAWGKETAKVKVKTKRRLQGKTEGEEKFP